MITANRGDDIHTETENGCYISFGSFGGVAMGHVSDTTLRRTFPDGRCYELNTSLGWVDSGGYSDKIKPPTETRKKRILVYNSTLFVLTFRFLRRQLDFESLA